MKRFLSLILSIIIVLSLVACGDKTATDNDNSQVEQNNTTSDTVIDSNQTGNETNNVPPTVNNNENSTDNGHTHTYKKVVVSPTCEKDGFTSYSCDCGAQYTEDTKIATGHKYSEWKEKKAPTENAVGKEERKCKNCEKIESRDIPKLIKGHTHSYTSSITKEATCQAEGTKTFSCTCGAKYTETIGKTNHNYKEETINPTCTSAGYTTHTCKVCGNAYTDSNKSATGHSWGSWVTVTAAAVGKAGQEKRTCSTCKTTETKTIPALQEDTTKKWFVNQYAIAKQQYINSLNSSISTKQAKIDDLRDDASDLYVNYMKEVQRIREKYAGSAGTLERALRDAQLNYNNSAQVYTNQIKSLESEIADIKTEIANPNVDNILAIVTKNCNISSRETYEYYNKYSDSLS